jgi:4-nitrophenyl phosphatase
LIDQACGLPFTRAQALTDLSPNLLKKIAAASGFIFDMDGTLALGDSSSGGHRALPYAIDLIAAIKARHIPLRVFTNGTAKPPALYAQSLRNAGFRIDDEEMMTPSSSAAAWFVQRKIKTVRVLGNEGVMAPLRDAGIRVVSPSSPATVVEAVYTGWFREFGFADLEAACNDVWNGARLTTASNVPFFATATGRGIGSSFAINAMIRALTKKQALVLGKPSRIAFDVACRTMHITGEAKKRVVIVGDDPALEMRMASACGVTGIGMTTGLMQRDTIDRLRTPERPTALLDSLKPLLDIFS